MVHYAAQSKATRNNTDNEKQCMLQKKAIVHTFSQKAKYKEA